MKNEFIKELIIKLGKIISYRSKILSSIELEQYDILGDVSVNFIKECKSVCNLYIKFRINEPRNYYDKKQSKQILFKIMSYIVNLIGKTTKITNENDITIEKRQLFINGLIELEILKDNYIYILRN